MKTFFSVFLGLFIGMSALMAQQKGTAVDDPNLGKLVELRTYGCYGFCPMYKLSIADNGNIEYEGIRFVKKIGKAQTKLKSSELTKLKSTIKQANLWQYPDTIRTQIVDAPTSSITVYDALLGSKSIYGSIDRPGPVLELEEYIKTLVEAHGLKVKNGVNPYSSSSNKADSKSLGGARKDSKAPQGAGKVVSKDAPKDQAEAISSLVVVQLKPKKTPEQLMAELKELKLALAERMPQADRYIFKFDPGSISADVVLQKLRASALVVSATLPYSKP